MKITLSNGNVVEGTLDELTTAGLLPTRSMATRAVDPRLDYTQLPRYAVAGDTAQPEATVAPAVVATPATPATKVGRPLAPLTIKIADAFDKLIDTGTVQRVSIAAKDEKKARATIYRTNRDRSLKVVANKIRIGDRIALVLSN